ncbi:MAG: hypothetical protein ACRCYL_11155 [Kluyvera sp.]
MFSKYACALLLLSMSTAAFATTSKEYALAGVNAVTAVMCLSDLQNYPPEKKAQESGRMDELMSTFLRDGHLFIEGAKGGKIDKEDMRKYVPVVLHNTDGLQISNDFYLGRVFQILSSAAFNQLADGMDSFSKTFAQELAEKASSAYNNANCVLIK